MPEATALLTSMLPVSDTETILANLASERAQAAKLSQDAVEAAIRKFLLSDLMALTNTEDLIKELRKRFRADPTQFDGNSHVNFSGEDNFPSAPTLEDCLQDWDQENRRMDIAFKEEDVELVGYLCLGSCSVKFNDERKVEIVE